MYWKIFFLVTSVVILFFSNVMAWQFLVLSSLGLVVLAAIYIFGLYEERLIDKPIVAKKRKHNNVKVIVLERL